jgi:hypothetical protein
MNVRNAAAAVQLHRPGPLQAAFRGACPWLPGKQTKGEQGQAPRGTQDQEQGGTKGKQGQAAREQARTQGKDSTLPRTAPCPARVPVLPCSCCPLSKAGPCWLQLAPRLALLAQAGPARPLTRSKGTLAAAKRRCGP